MQRDRIAHAAPWTGCAEHGTAQIYPSRALRATGAIDAASYLTHLNVKGHDYHWNIAQAVLATEDAYYRFDECRGEQARAELPSYKLERYTFDVPRRSDLPDGEQGLAEALAISHGVSLAKDLGNLPGNICTPTYLAEQAKKLSREGFAS